MQIAFATDGEPLSKLIRTATSCQWHHVGAVFNDEYVIEARFVGVVKTPLADFKARGKHLIVDCPVSDEDEALEFALAQLGKEYDFAGLISFPFRVKWQDPSKWYCSELVAAIATIGGSPIVRANLTSVSPRDLWAATK